MNLGILYVEIKNNYEEKIKNDEWYFSKFRESVLSNTDEKNCFFNIETVIGIILNEKDIFLVDELIVLLSDLIRKSQTTEIPKVLSDNLDALDDKFKSDDFQKKMWEEIKDYYYIT